MSDQPTIDDLVRRSIAGDVPAFGTLYDRTVRLVRPVAADAGPDAAADVTHDTFLRAYRTQYLIVPKSSAREFSFGLFARLGDSNDKAEQISGPKEIRGVKAEGFTVPWSSVVGDDIHADAKIQVWLDPATTLPVRVDLLGLGPHGSPVLRLGNFQWVKLGPSNADDGSWSLALGLVV